ncbi:MAG: RluA family pseudouridine synthase [Oscillospiraceae bacterium]|nr:RluA family pseudouridine synthase [Oscillospiraceae bacterium]
MSQLPPRRLELIVTQAQDGQEVNTLLRRTLGLSGTVLRRVKWLEDGITLDGARVHVRVQVREGQTLAVRLTDPSPTSGVVPAEGPLDIVYEDADLIVVNKAPGVLVHPGHGHFNDTLGNYLMWHYAQTGDGSDFHPVHRLDKGTSGLVVIAKHAHAQEKLKNQLHTGDFRRVYLAVCDGAPPEPAGTVDTPIGPVDGSLTDREVRTDGKPALTHYQILRWWGSRTLVCLQLETGRTHQIRVHMAHLGCPLTGDFLYGTEDRALIGRPALHSAWLELGHPITGERLAFSAPLPRDMAALIPEEDIS